MNAAHYSLRRTLPLWKFDILAQELLDCLEPYAIDEVIVKLDAEEFFHGHPSLEWAREYQKKLFWLKGELKKRGVLYSLNPWVTVGQCDRGRDDRNRFPDMQWMVGHDGTECRHCVCHLSEGWRKYLSELWGIYAETRPHILWVEDDIRSFNHEPVRFGCFCPIHMQRFSALAGRTVTRQEVVDALLAPGTPHPWRSLYLQMQQEILNDTAAFLATAVHRISPETSLGLMSSGPRQHCLEYRDWEGFASRLADGRPFYSRPPMYNYYEEGFPGLYFAMDTIKQTRAVLPPDTIEQTEIENVPFTQFSKSIAFTFSQMALSFAAGVQGVTLNLFDHTGSPMEKEPQYGRMLGKEKKYLNALATACQRHGINRGIRLFHANAASLCKELTPRADYAALAEDGYAMARALESLGISTTYQENASGITALSGQCARAASDDDLRQWLAQGLLLDAIAARILLERGYASLIGVTDVTSPAQRRDFPLVLSAEELLPPITDNRQCYLTATLPWLNTEARFSLLTPAKGTQVVSRFVNPDCQPVAPAMTAFQNSLGGRVIIHAIDYETSIGISFFNPERRLQFQWVMQFLGNGQAPLLFDCDGAYAYTWRKDTAECTIIGAFNFNLDEWNYLHFMLAWNRPLPANLRYLASDGRWKPCPCARCSLTHGMLDIVLETTVTYHRPFILSIPSLQETHP